jgi:8-oxo-dGTP pyrophosphatase MutT (NUDIX family)
MAPHRTPEHNPSGVSVIAAVGGIIYRTDKRGRVEVLLMRKRGGYWTLPKGKIKSDEDDATALMREVAEETGLHGRVESIVKIVRYVTPRRRPPQRKVVAYYLFRAEGGALCPSRSEQIVQLRWFPINLTLSRIHRRRVRRVVAAAIELLPSPTSAPSKKA